MAGRNWYRFWGETLKLPPEQLARRRLADCSPSWLAVGCNCARLALVKTGCWGADCQECRERVGSRRAAAVFDRMKGRPAGLPVVYTVFTVPPELRAKYRDPRAWSEVRRQVWKILKKFGALYGCEASHPFGDRKGDALFHPHLNFLWVPRERRQGFIPTEQLRAAWAKIIGAREVDIYSRYSSAEGKIRHWSRYVVRAWSGFSWWCGPVRWYGAKKFIKKPEKNGLCTKCGEEFRIMGNCSAVIQEFGTDISALKKFFKMDIEIIGENAIFGYNSA